MGTTTQSFILFEKILNLITIILNSLTNNKHNHIVLAENLNIEQTFSDTLNLEGDISNAVNDIINKPSNNQVINKKEVKAGVVAGPAAADEVEEEEVKQQKMMIKYILKVICMVLLVVLIWNILKPYKILIHILMNI